MWDENGLKYKEMKCANSSGKPVPPPDLLIDPLTTQFDYEIHLKSGVILRELQ